MGSPTSTSPLANVTVKNSILINGSSGTTNFIIANGTTSAGYFNNITVQNNDIRTGYNGFFVLADPAIAGNGDNLLITGNTIGNGVSSSGIYVGGVDGTATIANNNISLSRSSSGTTSSPAPSIGIWLGTGTNNTTISGNTISAKNTSTSITGSNYASGISVSSGATNTSTHILNNTITEVSGMLSYVNSSGIYIGGATSNVNIHSNKIFGLKNLKSGNLMQGILLGSSSTAANTIVYNNVISDVKATGSGQSNGIFIFNGAGYKVYNNTVNLNTSNSETGVSTAFYVLGGTSNVNAANAIDVRNNLLINNKTGGTRYSIYSTAANTVFENINYNDYYTTGTALGFIDNADKTTLADVQSGFGGNANSLNISPVFVSQSDFHLSSSANANLDNVGTPLAEVTTDFDGTTRGSNPDMGAFEFTYVTLAVSDTDKASDKISVYPNPFTEGIKISDIEEIKSIHIVDASGRSVKKFAPANELDLRDLKSGLYIVSFQMNNGSVKSHKVIKK